MQKVTPSRRVPAVFFSILVGLLIFEFCCCVDWSSCVFGWLLGWFTNSTESHQQKVESFVSLHSIVQYSIEQYYSFRCCVSWGYAFWHKIWHHHIIQWCVLFPRLDQSRREYWRQRHTLPEAKLQHRPRRDHLPREKLHRRQSRCCKNLHFCFDRE